MKAAKLHETHQDLVAPMRGDYQHADRISDIKCSTNSCGKFGSNAHNADYVFTDLVARTGAL
jgi:hypothetical protein